MYWQLIFTSGSTLAALLITPASPWRPGHFTIVASFAGAGPTLESTKTRIVAVMSAACFDDFSKKSSNFELGALAKPSFEMLALRNKYSIVMNRPGFAGGHLV
jgi:hypothetical protein